MKEKNEKQNNGDGMSRRRFLTTAATGLAGFWILPAISEASAVVRACKLLLAAMSTALSANDSAVT